MKAKLTFDLPEDEEAYRRAIDGPKMHSALWDIGYELLRSLSKHRELLPNQDTLLDEISGGFWNIVHEHGIDLG